MKFTKKLMVLLMTLLVTVSLCACSIGGGGGSGSKKVVYLTHDKYDKGDITSNVYNMVAQKAKADGIEIEVHSADGNANLQIDQLNAAINENPMAIVLLAVDGDAVVPSIKKANEKGIPIIATNRDVNGGVVTNIINDEKMGGILQGEYMAKHLPQGAKVVYLTGDMSISCATDRWVGFKEACLDKRPDIQLLAKTATGDWSEADGIKNLSLWMKLFPQIDGVVSANDNMVFGAMKEMQSVGKANGVIFCGIDATDNVLKEIEAGTIQQTVMQDVNAISDTIVEQLRTIAQGGKPTEGNVLVPLVEITKDNLARARQ